MSDLQRELAEAAIGGAKRGYYDARNRRQRVLRALARADPGQLIRVGGSSRDPARRGVMSDTKPEHRGTCRYRPWTPAAF